MAFFTPAVPVAPAGSAKTPQFVPRSFIAARISSSETFTTTPFRDMRLPRSVLWYYLIVLLISLFVKPTIGSTLYVIVLNFSFVLWILFVMQGISFLFFFIHEKGLPNMLKVVVAIIAIPFYSIVILLGIVLVHGYENLLIAGLMAGIMLVLSF